MVAHRCRLGREAAGEEAVRPAFTFKITGLKTAHASTARVAASIP